MPLDPHWDAFVAIPHAPQGAVGSAPAAWAASCGLTDIPDADRLPARSLVRQHVRALCADPSRDVLLGYVCAMAWGGQSKRNALLAWAERARLAEQLGTLRAGCMACAEAYSIFAGRNHIPGLGPAYFTKLLHFFNPTLGCYIMDQWTGRSVNLIVGRQVVPMDGDFVSGTCTGAQYDAFCAEVERMAAVLGCSGETIEERLFSQGGRKPWPWRAYVRAHG